MQMAVDAVAEIFGTLWSHKLRSFLTMFGIAWGVGSLLLLVGLGEGFRTGNLNLALTGARPVGVVVAGHEEGTS